MNLASNINDRNQSSPPRNLLAAAISDLTTAREMVLGGPATDVARAIDTNAFEMERLRIRIAGLEAENLSLGQRLNTLEAQFYMAESRTNDQVSRLQADLNYFRSMVESGR